MRLLAFTDIHEDKRLLERMRRIVSEEKVDLIVCAGDFTIFGRSTKEMIRSISQLGKKVLLIHGNHEDGRDIAKFCSQTKNVIFLHEKIVDVEGFKFIGFGGGGFRSVEPGFEEFDKRIASEYDQKTIIVSHAPPKDTMLDRIDDDWHVGNETLARIVKRRKPLMLLCGHIHECFHAHDTLAGTVLINPGPDGEIIDLEQ
jgi:putative phosphoesterase